MDWLQCDQSIRLACQWRIQDFPEGGEPIPEFGAESIIWQDFCQKLHGNERNGTERGACIPGVPIGSANAYNIILGNVTFMDNGTLLLRMVTLWAMLTLCKQW